MAASSVCACLIAATGIELVEGAALGGAAAAGGGGGLGAAISIINNLENTLQNK